MIEDDEGMREAIASLLTAAGLATTVYASAETLLAAGIPAHTRCIVSDVRLPSMSGLDLLGELRQRGACPPVILITAHDSPAMRSEASRRGAAAYLPKPFGGAALLEAIARATPYEGK
ncbi:MAG: response regulator [Burkholderiales bacterium]|nr:response regulator [Burkholderiales bacterium]